jgi:hypothetical protein
VTLKNVASANVTSSLFLVTLMTEVLHHFEISVLTSTTQCHIPKFDVNQASAHSRTWTEKAEIMTVSQKITAEDSKCSPSVKGESFHRPRMNCNIQLGSSAVETLFKRPKGEEWRLLGCYALVRTDVSEEHSASVIRVSKISALGTTLALTSNRLTLRRNTKLTHSLTRFL